MNAKKKPVFYSIQEVASILSLSERTVRRHVLAGYLRSFRVGHQYRISEKDLETYLMEKYTFSPRGVF